MWVTIAIFSSVLLLSNLFIKFCLLKVRQNNLCGPDAKGVLLIIFLLTTFFYCATTYYLGASIGSFWYQTVFLESQETLTLVILGQVCLQLLLLGIGLIAIDRSAPVADKSAMIRNLLNPS